MTKKPAPTLKRGRPATGRKIVFQVPLDPDDAAAIKRYADASNRTLADVLRTAALAYLQRRTATKSRGGKCGRRFIGTGGG